MRISKTDFLKIMNYKLEEFPEIQKKYAKFVIKTEEELLEENKLEKLKEFMASSFESDIEEEDEEVEKIVDEQLEMMLPFYNKFEQTVGQIIEGNFEGSVIYSPITFKQKMFSLRENDTEFYCFVDVYQEDEDTIRIFETKATTSSRYSVDKDRFYFASKGQGRKKTRNKFFVEDKIGTLDVMVPFETTGKPQPEESDYNVRREKLMDRFTDQGKNIYDLAYQRYIISRSLAESNKKIEYYLVTLNHKYVYDGLTNDQGEAIYSDELIKVFDMTEIVKDMDGMIGADMSFVESNIGRNSLLEQVMEKYKSGGRMIQSVLKEYFKEEIDQPHSIFNYIGRHYGFDKEGEKVSLQDLLFEDGWFKASDVPLQYLSRENNRIQRRSITENVPIYNKEKIQAGLKLLKYPIYHLDFESFNSPIPRFVNEKPYTQSLFQFSVHIERTPGIMDFEKDNISFLNKDHGDHRRELVEALLKAIPIGNGTVLVYHASFERGRLEEMQVLFPEHYDHLQNIIERLFDLIHIVKGNSQLYTALGFEKTDAGLFNYYHPDLEGSYSLKKVLPVFSDLSYDDLDVYNGVQAMITYVNFPTMDEELFKTKYENLLFYCKQDTWAMFDVLNQIRLLVKDDE